MTSESTVIADRINKTYSTRSGELSILHDANLALHTGDSVAIMGPSGSGKSTLLNILGTLESPDSGDYTVSGTHPFSLSPRGIARFRNRTIGFVFQEHHLLPQCTVLENVLIPTLAGTHAADPVTVTERAKQLLDKVGLTDRLDHKPPELSGGERQRVAIARALINKPTLLLADEPTGNLDRKTADSIANLLVESYKSEGLALVVVTHSESLARRFDRTLELVDGALEQAT